MALLTLDGGQAKHSRPHFAFYHGPVGSYYNGNACWIVPTTLVHYGIDTTIKTYQMWLIVVNVPDLNFVTLKRLLRSYSEMVHSRDIHISHRLATVHAGHIPHRQYDGSPTYEQSKAEH